MVLTFIDCHMNILKKDELTASIHRIDRFEKSKLPIYNCEIVEMIVIGLAEVEMTTLIQ